MERCLFALRLGQKRSEAVMFRSSPCRLCILLVILLVLVVVPDLEGFLVMSSAPTSAVHANRLAGRRIRVARKPPNPEILTRLAAANGEGAAAAGGGPPGSSGGGSTCTCRNCKQQFRRGENADGACSFHPGLFSGRLNRVNDVDTSGLEYFWSCCGQPDRSHPGCTTGRHLSYDDPEEEGGIRSPLTGQLR